MVEIVCRRGQCRWPWEEVVGHCHVQVHEPETVIYKALCLFPKLNPGLHIPNFDNGPSLLHTRTRSTGQNAPLARIHNVCAGGQQHAMRLPLPQEL